EHDLSANDCFLKFYEMNEIKNQLNIAVEKLGEAEEELKKLANLRNMFQKVAEKWRDQMILLQDALIKLKQEESNQKLQELSEKLETLQTSKGKDDEFFKQILFSCENIFYTAMLTNLYCRLQHAFNLKGPLTDHKFVIVNKEIDMSCSKKEFFDFIEIHKCSINNLIRIYDVKKGAIRSYMDMLGDLPAPSKLGEPDEWVKRQKNDLTYFNRTPSASSG
ncbi:11612_t:CDS:2, partial [Funneliformis caledonium]